jgi:hypothetical protein
MIAIIESNLWEIEGPRDFKENKPCIAFNYNPGPSEQVTFVSKKCSEGSSVFLCQVCIFFFFLLL